MESWPDTLPGLFLGTTVGDDDSCIRTGMDAGPASVRNRFTATPQSVSVPMILTGEQLAIFNTFRRTTLSFGSASFNWKDPATDATVVYRFKRPPEFKSIRSGSVNSRLWAASLELEILPS